MNPSWMPTCKQTRTIKEAISNQSASDSGFHGGNVSASTFSCTSQIDFDLKYIGYDTTNNGIAVEARATSTSEYVDRNWDKLLYCWHRCSKRQIPDNQQLQAFSVLTGISIDAIEARFHEFLASGSMPQRFDEPCSALPIPTPMRNRISQAVSKSETSQLKLPSRELLCPAEILLELIRREATRRNKRGCIVKRDSEKGSGKFQCTLRCGKHFRNMDDLRRHEECSHSQQFWFYTKRRNTKDPDIDSLFIRKDKFVNHIRRQHNSLDVGETVITCKVDFVPEI
jgi:hypothetical protein